MSKILMIPEILKVGFQYRQNTISEKLAYIIYFDEKNKLRKEKSFNSWIDHKIPTIETENKVISGFRLLSNIKRNPYHFGETVEKVRVFDPRGFEFEISISNLMFLFDHGNLIDLEYQGECVFAWDGTELVLLPTNSIAYKENTEKMKSINKNIKAKDLIVGASYNLKKNNLQYIYLGQHFMIPTFNHSKNVQELIAKMKKYEKRKVAISDLVKSRKKTHIFLSVSEYGMEVISLSSLATLSTLNNKVAMDNDEVEEILASSLISQVGFEEGVQNSTQNTPTCFFENEKYELFLKKSSSYYSSNIHALLVTKSKNSIIKLDDMDREELSYVYKCEQSGEERKEKYIVIRGEKIPVVF